MNNIKRKSIILAISTLLLMLVVGGIIYISVRNNIDKYDTKELLANKEILNVDEMEELSRKTLVVIADNIELNDSNALSVDNIGNVYTFTYNTTKETENAYKKYSSLEGVIYCEYDTAIITQEKDIELDPNLFPTEEQLEEVRKEAEKYKDGLIEGNPEDKTYLFIEGKPEVVYKNENVLPNILENIQPNKYEYKPTGRKAIIVVIDSGANGDFKRSYNVYDGSTDVTDIVGHGTRMVETIRKELVNYKEGIDYEIIPIKIANSNGLANVSSLIKALEYAQELNPTIINISLTSTNNVNDSIIEAYINKFEENQIVTCVSAGNNGEDASRYIPSKFDKAFVFGACDKLGNRLSFSNYGDSVDYNIVSTSTSEASAIGSSYFAKSYIEGLFFNSIIVDENRVFLPSGIHPIKLYNDEINYDSALVYNAYNNGTANYNDGDGSWYRPSGSSASINYWAMTHWAWRGTSYYSYWQYYDKFKDSHGRCEAAVYDIGYAFGGRGWDTTYFSGTSNEGCGGYEVLLKVDGVETWIGRSNYDGNSGSRYPSGTPSGATKSESTYTGYNGIVVKEIWFQWIEPDLLQTNIVVRNDNSYAKSFQIATLGDIVIAQDDNATVTKTNDGFTMSNKFCDYSADGQTQMPMTQLHVYTSGNQYVTDATRVWAGYFTDRKANAFGSAGNYVPLRMNSSKHAPLSSAWGGADATDSGFAISWDKTLSAGEVTTFSYLIGISEADATSVVDINTWVNGNRDDSVINKTIEYHNNYTNNQTTYTTTATDFYQSVDKGSSVRITSVSDCFPYTPTGKYALDGYDFIYHNVYYSPKFDVWDGENHTQIGSSIPYNAFIGSNSSYAINVSVSTRTPIQFNANGSTFPATGNFVASSNGNSISSDRKTAIVRVFWGRWWYNVMEVPNAIPGYTFNGYWTSASGGTQIYYYDKSTNTARAKEVSGWFGDDGWENPSTSTVYLYAQWIPNTYTVTYNANGGSGAMANSSAVYDSNFITSRNNFTRTGYTFNGWNEKADGTGTAWPLTSSGVYESGIYWKWTYTKNITLYAQWIPANSYTIKFDANGGSGSVPSTITKIGSNSSVEMGDIDSVYPTRTGYRFAGWSQNQTIISTNKRIAYSEYDNETAYTKGVTITSDDWTFDDYGWQTSNPQSLPTSKTITLYAQWVPLNSYTIVFHANGGTGNIPGTITQSGSDINTVMDDITSDCPTRTGYTFLGWTAVTSQSPRNPTTLRIAYNSSSGGGNDYNGNKATVTSSSWSYKTYCEKTGGSTSSNTLDLYAVWQENKQLYTITFNAPDRDGGSLPSNLSVTTYRDWSFNDIDSDYPTLTGYRFIGWTQSGKNSLIAYTKYDDTNRYTTNATTTSSDWSFDDYCSYTGGAIAGNTLNLYAKWTPKTDTPYTINIYTRLNPDASYSLYSSTAYSGTTGSSVALSNYTSLTNYTLDKALTDGANCPTTFTIKADGSRVVDIYFTHNKVSYKVNYYLQKSGQPTSPYNTTNYTKDSQSYTRSEYPGKFIYMDDLGFTGYSYATTIFDESKVEKSSTGSFKVNADGSTELNSYYILSTYTYYVRHYVQNKDTTDSSNTSNYTLSKTETKTTIYNTSVTANPIDVTNIKYYNKPSSKTATISTNGNIYIDLYYPLKTVTFKFYDGSTLLTTKTYYSQQTTRSWYSGNSITGYTNSKWTTNSNGTGTSYSLSYNLTDDDVINNSGSTITLYLQRTKNSSTLAVSNDSKKGTVTGTGQKTYGSTTSLSVSPINYTATFNANGGTCSVSSITTNIAFSSFSKPATMYGSLSSTTTNPATYTYGSTNGVTDTITITYSGSHTITLPTPTRTGYTFTGWKSSIDSTIKSSGVNVTLTSNITYTAQWTINSYTQNTYAKYQDKDGNWGNYTLVDTKSVNYGNKYSYSTTATDEYNSASVEEYTVTGAKDNYINVSRKTYRQIIYARYQDENGVWGNYSAVLDKNYYYGSTVSWTQAETDAYNQASVSYVVYAAHSTYLDKAVDVTRKTHKVTLTYDTTSIDSVEGAGTYYYGQTITVKATLKTGYHWANWTNTSTNDVTTTQTFTFVMGTSDISLKATGTANTYTVKLYPNKPTTTNNSHASSNDVAKLGSTGWTWHNDGYYYKTFTYDSTTIGIAPSNIFSLIGWHTDSNWYTGNTSTNKGSIYTSGSKNLTSTNNGTVNLYVQWVANTYTVKYNKGNTTDTTTTMPSDVTWTYDKSYTLPDTTVKGTSYSIIFNTNKPNNATNSPSVINNISGTLPFSKWDKGNVGDSISNLTTTNNGTVTITALYSNKDITYTNSTLTGWTFNGWINTSTNAKETGITITPGTSSISKSYKANWTANTYTVNLYPNKPTLSLSAVQKTSTLSGWTWNNNGYWTKTYTYDSSSTLPNPSEAFTLSGYTVKSDWYKSDKTSIISNYNGTISGKGTGVWNLATSGTVSLYANWVDANPNLKLTSTNTQLSNSQTLSISMDDYGSGIKEYYFGTNSDYTKNTKTNGNLSSVINITKTITESGIYYVTVIDNNNNITTDSARYCITTFDANTKSYSTASVGTSKTITCYQIGSTKTNNSFTFPTATQTGYHGFGNDNQSNKSNTWATIKNATIGVSSLTPIEDATYYATWIANTYTLTLNKNVKPSNATSDVVCNTTTYTMTYGSTNNSQVEKPTLVGWDDFTGWYDAVGVKVYNGGLATSTNTKVSYNNASTTYWNNGVWIADKNVVLTGRWVANTYTVVLKSNRPLDPRAASAIMETLSPTGWTLGTYKHNNVDEPYYSKTFTYDTECLLPAVTDYTMSSTNKTGTFYLHGWTTIGWFKNGDNNTSLSVDKVIAGTSKFNLTTTKDDTVVLYAHWTENNYKIEYDPNGGESVANNSNEENFLYEDTTTLPDTVRPGYTFDGWSNKDGDVYKGKINIRIIQNIINNDKDSIVHFTAVWTKKKVVCLGTSSNLTTSDENNSLNSSNVNAYAGAVDKNWNDKQSSSSNNNVIKEYTVTQDSIK